MDSSVRYIQLDNAGQKPALCFRGDKVAHCIVNDETRIRCIEVSLQDHDKALIVKRLGHDYLPAAFASAMRRIMEKKPITKRAKELIDNGTKLDGSTKLAPDVIDAEHEVKVPMREITRKGARRVEKVVSTTDDELGVIEVPSDDALEAAAAVRKGPRKVVKAPTPMPIAPLPPKAATGAKKEAKAKPTRGAGVHTLVSILAAEAGLAQQPCRVKLRAGGLRAPYDELKEAACRKVLGLPARGKK
jgi:hypothetical protein